jgi:hypothetical protein
LSACAFTHTYTHMLLVRPDAPELEPHWHGQRAATHIHTHTPPYLTAQGSLRPLTILLRSCFFRSCERSSRSEELLTRHPLFLCLDVCGQRTTLGHLVLTSLAPACVLRMSQYGASAMRARGEAAIIS